MINIKLDINELTETISINQNLVRELPKCISRALNRSLDMTKTEQLRKTLKQYNVKRSKLYSSINVFKSNKDKLKGYIHSSGRTIGLDHFKLNPKTRKPNKVVTVSVKKGSMKSIPGAFIAYHDGRLGAFARKSTSAKYPIKRLKGPSAPQMLGEISILEYLQGYADAKFRMRLEHEMNRVIK